jgi:8-oxo-dGTP pyrophosphatase MutT (NUDIX family)
VPAGTVKPGEDPKVTAMREAHEETGLIDLEFAGLLDQDTRDMRDCGIDELQTRWFYHLRYRGVRGTDWTHGECAPDGTVVIPFNFLWCNLSSLPPLTANYDDKIPLIMQKLSGAAPEAL